MTDDARQQAWRRFCAQLEALGVDPYSPQVPADDPRHPQVQALLTEYKIAAGEIIPVPPGWEGHPPLRPLSDLAGVADWLKDQWTFVLATEVGGDKYKASALEQATRAVRNAFRVLDWLKVEDRPERPLAADTVAVAKEQIDALERWVRRKLRDGWQPAEQLPAPAVTASTGQAPQRRRRGEMPDDYEVNILVKRHLDQHPRDGIRQVAEAVGLSVGKVQQTDAWRREMGRRKAEKEPAKKTPRPLTQKMLAGIGQEDNIADIDARLDAEEAVWQRLLEQASPSERARLHAMNRQERRELIELARDQFADQLADSDACS
jgi:hypothetical protein